MIRTITTKSADETRALAATLAAELRAGAILVLIGDFGSGKTTFVQGLARGLAVPDLSVVCSPTFVMLNVYEGGRLPLYHLDATRLDDPQEVFRLGWDPDRGVAAIEWGDRVSGAIRAEIIEVKFEVVGAEKRRIAIGRKNANRTRKSDGASRRTP